MHHRAPATLQVMKYDSWRWRKSRFAVAFLCLVLVCLFAGISAVHAHPFSQHGTSLSQAAAPCELCAVAFQPALLFAILLLCLHAVSVNAPSPADPKSKSQFRGTSLWSRPPPIFIDCWNHSQLKKIIFVNRRKYVEPYCTSIGIRSYWNQRLGTVGEFNVH